MKHLLKGADGRQYKIRMTCNHPEMENNQCPTGTGRCAECEFGVAKCSIADMIELIKSAGLTL